MEMESEARQETEERKEAKRKKRRKWALRFLLAALLLYAVYLAVPRRLTTMIPNVYQAENIAIHYHGMEEYWTLTVKGNDMRQLIDYLDQFIFLPSQPFSDISTGGYQTYYGEVYNFYIYMGNGERWRVIVSDQGDVGFENIFGRAWFREGKFKIQRDHVQVLPPEIEEQMERHEIS